MNYNNIRCAFLVIMILFIYSCKRKDNSLRYEVTGELHKPPKGTHRQLQIKSIHLIDSVLGSDIFRKEREWNNSYSEKGVYYEIKYIIDTTNGKNIYINYDLDLNLIDWDTVYYID